MYTRLHSDYKYLLVNKQYSFTNKNSAVAEMGDRGHNRHGPKRRGLLCPFRGGAGSPSNTMSPRLRQVVF